MSFSSGWELPTSIQLIQIFVTQIPLSSLQTEEGLFWSDFYLLWIILHYFLDNFLMRGGFPAVRMRANSEDKKKKKLKVKMLKKGLFRTRWCVQTSLVWFQLTLNLPIERFDRLPGNIRTLPQRSSHFLCCVISDFRCGYGTMSFFFLQSSYWEMFACRGADSVILQMKTNHSPYKNWLNDRL